MKINSKNLLEGDNISQVPCPKNKQKFGTNLPDTVIIHYTRGASAKSSADWLSRNEVKASAHLVIGREGEIYQLVPFDTISWHAGPSSFGGRDQHSFWLICLFGLYIASNPLFNRLIVSDNSWCHI